MSLATSSLPYAFPPLIEIERNPTDGVVQGVFKVILANGIKPDSSELSLLQRLLIVELDNIVF